MKDLSDRKAKRILDMLARKAGGYEFITFSSCSMLDAPLIPSVNYHDVHHPAESNTRFLLKKNNFIYIKMHEHERAYSVILKKLLEIAAKQDIAVNAKYNPVFMKKGTTFEELLIQLDLEA